MIEYLERYHTCKYVKTIVSKFLFLIQKWKQIINLWLIKERENI
jgi:hypothetical protein